MDIPPIESADIEVVRAAAHKLAAALDNLIEVVNDALGDDPVDIVAIGNVAVEAGLVLAAVMGGQLPPL